MVALAGCARVDQGHAVAEPSASSVTTTDSSTPSSPSSPSTSAPDTDEPGVLPTNRTPVPANTVTCSPEARPPVSVAAAVADPAAPRITVGVPDGWSFTQGTGDVAVTMQGPQELSATVTITPTKLAPDAAFREYTDALMEQSAISTVSILPAQLCDYSGQKMMGTWADEPDTAVEFHDRVVHVWTSAGDYLIAIHVEGPAGSSSDLDAASTVITDDVELTIP